LFSFCFHFIFLTKHTLKKINFYFLFFLSQYHYSLGHSIFSFFVCFLFFVYIKLNYGVALHMNGISDSSDSASESVVQSFDEESVVHSDK